MGKIFLMALILCSGCSINNTSQKDDISIKRSGESTSNGTVIINSQEWEAPCRAIKLGSYKATLDYIAENYGIKQLKCACLDLKHVAKYNTNLNPNSDYNIKLRELNTRFNCNISNIPNRNPTSLIIPLFKNKNGYK